MSLVAKMMAKVDERLAEIPTDISIDAAGVQLFWAELWQNLAQHLARADALRFIAAHYQPASKPNPKTLMELKHTPGIARHHITLGTFREALIESGIRCDGERAYCKEVKHGN